MRFIDLFSGLGGFHVGLTKHGHQCVFACEIDDELRILYSKNHKISPYGDIRNIKIESIPEHEILCAGFPCQPFSLAGKKRGAKCPESGKLIQYVIDIAKKHTPQIILLENVPNIITIEEGKFWRYVKSSFERIGYTLDYKVFSPSDFGIPQNRKRVFVVGLKKGGVGFTWPLPNPKPMKSLYAILDDSLPHMKLEAPKCRILKKWQILLDKLSLDELPSISLVAPEFGATYPINFVSLQLDEIRQFNGAYGVPLKNCASWDEVLLLLPSYVRNHSMVPNWLIKSVNFSRNLYHKKTDICLEWSHDLPRKYNSWQILEWRGERHRLTINAHLVQFRASGIRVLRSHIAPSLISMTPTQIPIIPEKNRYLAPLEAAKLQYLHTLPNIPKNPRSAFKAFGNAVNAKIIELIAGNLPMVSVG